MDKADDYDSLTKHIVEDKKKFWKHLYKHTVDYAPKLAWTDANKMTYTAFKASSMCVFTCRKCNGLVLGCNLAWLAEKETPGYHEFRCKPCFLALLVEEPAWHVKPIVIYHVDYAKAAADWKVKNFKIIHGFQQYIQRAAFEFDPTQGLDVNVNAPFLPLQRHLQ